MVNSRKEFKKALNHAKANEHKEVCQSIAEKFINTNFRQFWKDVRKQKGCVKSTNTIDGENQSDKIVNIFANKFLLGQQEDESKEEEFVNMFKNMWDTGKKMHIKLSLETLKKLISSLNSGMGHDRLHSQFFKNASREYLLNVVLLLNACFTHCYMPWDVLKGLINPTVKDRKGNITESANYRPVMQSSCLFQIFETHMLNILSETNFFLSKTVWFQSWLVNS